MTTGAAGTLCRDCLTHGARLATRFCRSCGSPRLVSHDDLFALTVAHVDCDAFYASVEKRDDPSLVALPVIVGGGKRGVVATCCYVARTFGVRSAMPMFKALALCPQAMVIKPDMAKYGRVGREIRAMMSALTPLVEPLSIDEAFLDLGGTTTVHGTPPAVTLAAFAARVEREVGVSVSIGLSDCKFLAKVASEEDKPRGFAVIGRTEAAASLAPRPIGVIWGVGAVAQARLAAQGLSTIADLQALSEHDLFRRFGPEGGRLWRLAHGIDARPVSPVREAKGISAETTFDADHADLAQLEPILFRLCERLSARLKAAGRATGGVTLKLKTADFKTRTRARSDLAPTQLAARLFEAAAGLLRAEPAGTRYRLLGIGANGLLPAEDADRGDLLDASLGRVKAIEGAIDALRDKFGAASIERGITFRQR